jgi:hypothetical protein
MRQEAVAASQHFLMVQEEAFLPSSPEEAAWEEPPKLQVLQAVSRCHRRNRQQLPRRRPVE